ncbi:MAG TPA: hypothetical protein PLJ08_13645 [Cyclobacteriaceae bacterium]|nr:hypothetical protein [Cyclobacteriaceae bacterium]
MTTFSFRVNKGYRPYATFEGMYHFRLLLLLIALTSFLFLVIGLFKPWLMLWWEDVQNRKKVIKLYGTTALLFLVLYFILGFWI